MNVAWLLLLIVLSLPSIQAYSYTCPDFGLDACVDPDNRPSVPCGRSACSNRMACLWCIYNTSSPAGECLTRDPCASLNDSIPLQCTGGYIESKDTIDCTEQKTLIGVIISFASLIPSIFFAMMIHEVAHRSYPLYTSLNSWTRFLAFASMFILLVCVATVERDYRMWGFLWIPSLVIPLGLTLFHVTVTYCRPLANEDVV